VVAALGVTCAVLLAGCGSAGGSADGASGDGATTTTARPFDQQTGKGRVEVNVTDNTFEPRYLQVSAGTTLVFTNNGRNPHDIKPVTDGAFDEVTPEKFQPGATAGIVVTKTGEIAYYCSIHGTPKNGQNGIIKVVS